MFRRRVTHLCFMIDLVVPIPYLMSDVSCPRTKKGHRKRNKTFPETTLFSYQDIIISFFFGLRTVHFLLCSLQKQTKTKHMKTKKNGRIEYILYKPVIFSQPKGLN